MIDENLLLNHGAKRVTFSKGDQLFREGESALNFYQIASGEIKMNNYNEDGKEFIQGIFSIGQSFGEPPLLANVKYPANAEAISDSEVFQLTKEQFLELLSSNPRVHLKITETLAKRLYYKAIMVSEISSQEPEHRILRIIDYLKHVDKVEGQFAYRLDLTRQQLADLTGLRVETVIRATKSLEKKGELQIKKRKVYR
ncbi:MULTISPECIES: Crp/Fnr family transcriptional regulator [Salinimicrobium]|uniref:Crp/Fnr family transcriptional regulator n=1 Tax=Salinimicrobium TaxID=561367 RepID=UPI001E3C6636|nr:MULTISPECIES: Crp/Fnr family transcriptional regulator [Salinimicrobium]MCC8361038.1 Crp/Fnr family transcriptional regulator [Salinimicrobium sediminilitoris]MCY2686174.1 Crp/Fnr family transcriptional regulator [Salinimicrobium sp. TH3]